MDDKVTELHKDFDFFQRKAKELTLMDQWMSPPSIEDGAGLTELETITNKLERIMNKLQNAFKNIRVAKDKLKAELHGHDDMVEDA
ncbi:hypothetical protein BT96DRAFT_1007217 [Gymnopus androsaceus JB14]|uniref:Syntaxin N-terminal domain-containing protein n=1 Tax=Gymnopus androsaceus JB14 TaxID=1447944 RepID=A0A6A4GHW6_9AGAR|nr:hypothetical protein BT96DRAFT_1007217 [Gymnopus androsaceus JB14]